MSTRASLLIPAIAATVVALAPCFASAADAGASGIRLAYSDLNLESAAGVAALYERVRGAAERYCEPARQSTGTRVSPAFTACVKDVVDTTVRKINLPNLSALHASHATGGDRHS